MNDNVVQENVIAESKQTESKQTESSNTDNNVNQQALNDLLKEVQSLKEQLNKTQSSVIKEGKGEQFNGVKNFYEEEKSNIEKQKKEAEEKEAVAALGKQSYSLDQKLLEIGGEKLLQVLQDDPAYKTASLTKQNLLKERVLLKEYSKTFDKPFSNSSVVEKLEKINDFTQELTADMVKDMESIKDIVKQRYDDLQSSNRQSFNNRQNNNLTGRDLALKNLGFYEQENKDEGTRILINRAAMSVWGTEEEKKEYNNKSSRL